MLALVWLVYATRSFYCSMIKGYPLPLHCCGTTPAMAPPQSRYIAAPWTWTRPISILVVVVALFSVFIWYLESNLESFYIFSPDQLHDLSVRAIDVHGNDTRSVVEYIVSELSSKLSGGYINLDEEWIFNNAGGAMGAMYIIHASELIRMNPGRESEYLD